MDDYTATNPADLRKSPKGFLTAILLVALLGSTAYVGWKIGRGTQWIDNGGSNSDSELIAVVPTGTVDPNQTIYVNETVQNTTLQQGPLVLVNNQLLYTETSAADVISVYDKKNDRYHVSSIDVMLRTEAVDALNAMMEGFFAASGLDDVQLISGYRTLDYQQQLYDRDLAATGQETSSLVAKPGYSEHQTGYAMDFNVLYDGYSEDFDGGGNFTWIPANCQNYGFVLRYPQSKAAITFIEYEPWHYRYVGIPHAIYMTGNNLCLEEYMDVLRQHPYGGEHLMLTDNQNNAFEAYYVGMDTTADSTMVPVPSDLPYTISGNNVDGFIVTVNMGTKSEPATDAPAATEPAPTEPAATPEE